jgi:hypothetical protein
MANKGAKIQEEHAWLATQNLAQYAGCWLAVFRNSIIATGKDLASVVTQVKNQDIDDEAPRYIRVPEGLVTI